MRSLPAVLALLLLTLTPSTGAASPYVLFDQWAFLHIGGGGPSASPLGLDMTDPGRTEALDADGLGEVSWTFVNDTAAIWSQVSLVLFTDGEFGANGAYADEYGEFLGLDLPDGVPSDALAPDRWEIDEPGWVFGDIFINAEDDVLDGTNAVGPGGPVDDVAFAFGWTLPDLAPGDRLALTLRLQSAGITGISHHDPDLQAAVFATAFVQHLAAPDPDPDDPPTHSVPEPGGVTVLAAAAIWAARRFCGARPAQERRS